MVSNYKPRLTIFGEDSLLARAISDSLEVEYDIINSYSHPAKLPRSFVTEWAWSPEIDATDESLVSTLVRLSDIVVNCTGLVNTDKCIQDLYGAYRSNVLTALTIAKACQTYDKKLVHLATTASYASSQIIDEETDPAMFQTMYSGTKLLGETIVKQHCPEALIIRPCFVYGGGRDTSSVLKKLIYRALTKNQPNWEITLSLDNSKDYLWVEDFARGVRTLLEQRQTGVWNVSNGSPLKYRNLVHLLELRGLSIENIVWRPDLDYLGNHLVDNKKLLGLGWKPDISIEEGIDKIIKEFHENSKT